MIQIRFVAPDGATQVVAAEPGLSVMEAARRAGVPGIIAECGGACSCATCHVHVAADWMARVGGPDPLEEDMLDFAENVGETSRLSCQIPVTEALDGLVLYLPG
ncbi:2Fe-2S iron-sulfur cluster-binding protein [Pararhodobacter sp.]|uniref:2Fe-2S iron-sulfur cluster-binding protein n=1 Tax=Pararhodobacter sp. TaxID=2127056 RepID=UPI002FE06AA1